MGFGELLFCGLGLDKYVRKVFKNYNPIETAEIHCTENEALRMRHHDQFNQTVYTNRMPPAYWYSQIDKLIKPEYQLSKPERIK